MAAWDSRATVGVADRFSDPRYSVDALDNVQSFSILRSTGCATDTGFGPYPEAILIDSVPAWLLWRMTETQ